jgi:hypothetical protein
MPRSPQPLSSAVPARFDEEYARALRGLRSALDALLRAAGGDPARPQDLSRRFGLNKNLAWKASRLVGSEEPSAALRFIPGASGMSILRQRLEAAGETALHDFDRALARFDAMLARHAGDRATLEMMVSGAAGEGPDPVALLQSRRQAFLGNAAVFGVQTRVQHVVYALGPSRSAPGHADLVLAMGLVDFRRTRSDARWLLSTLQSFQAEDGSLALPNYAFLEEPGTDTGGVPLLREFCSMPLPKVEVRRYEKELRYELPGGAIGNQSRQTCYFGVMNRAAGPSTSSEPGAQCELATNLLTPAEILQFDLLIDERLAWPAAPTAGLYGRMDGRPPYGAEERVGRNLCLTERPLDLGLGLEGLTSSHVARCRELIGDVLQRSGMESQHCRTWRLTLAYPPSPATFILSVELPRP